MDRYKAQFATSVAQAFAKHYSEIHAATGDRELFDPEVILENIQKPKDPSMGRFALPVFRWSKLLKQKPNDIASSAAPVIEQEIDHLGQERLITVEAAGGFLNARVDTVKLAVATISEALTHGAHFADGTLGTGRTILVEYSSPNIAKPFGVGHLRSTILGHSLRRIYQKLGYTVVGINYPGDWGTQFGKMIVAYKKWGSPDTLEGAAVKKLLDLYVKYHVEATTDPSLDDQARDEFRRLEDGDAEATKLWQKFKAISNAEFERVYGLLGIEFDLVYGESFLNDKMEPVIDRLTSAGLTSTSRSALVVDLHEGEDRPPLLLKKADGATLYATRDLAGLVYRWETYPNFSESLYVVNTSQSEHFRQCLKTIDMLEQAENLPTEQCMTGHVKHVEFGWVRFDGKSMSTRAGNIVLLEDVINQAVERVQKIIEEKNPDLASSEAQAGVNAEQSTAHQIGVGAVIYSQLSVRRQTDIDFRWEEVLSFEGETGPYLQYTHARLCSLLRRAARDVTGEVDYQLLDHLEEQRVIEMLADFTEAIELAGSKYEPYFVTNYLVKLAAAFNRFYQRKNEQGKIDKIISENDTLTLARLALVKAVQTVMNQGLYLLGLEAPEEM